MHGGELLSTDHDGRVRLRGAHFQWLGYQCDLSHIHGDYSRLSEFEMPKIADPVCQAE